MKLNKIILFILIIRILFGWHGDWELVGRDFRWNRDYDLGMDFDMESLDLNWWWGLFPELCTGTNTDSDTGIDTDTGVCIKDHHSILRAMASPRYSDVIQPTFVKCMTSIGYFNVIRPIS
jgi:hypothetical protein